MERRRLFKGLEAAAFVYAATRDEELDRQMDAIIEVIGKAQRADGYLHTPVTAKTILTPRPPIRTFWRMRHA